MRKWTVWIMLLGIIHNAFAQESKAYLLNDIGCGIEGAQSRIINGKPAEVNQFPWVVHVTVLNETSRRFCVGSLITSRFVLSAGHCIQMMRFTQIQVRYGNIRWRDARRTEAAAYIRHKHYVHRHFQHDIMLLYLSKALDLTRKFIGTLCLPIPAFSITHMIATVAGWGHTSVPTKKADNSPTLLYTKQIVQSQEYCKRHRTLKDNNYEPDHHICLYQDNTDSCVGDSGGPVMVRAGRRWVLVGIVSYGFSCNQPGMPAMATNIETHMDWIRDTIRDSPQYIANVTDIKTTPPVVINAARIK